LCALSLMLPRPSSEKILSGVREGKIKGRGGGERGKEEKEGKGGKGKRKGGHGGRGDRSKKEEKWEKGIGEKEERLGPSPPIFHLLSL
jgi:hypothetical protein